MYRHLLNLLGECPLSPRYFKRMSFILYPHASCQVGSMETLKALRSGNGLEVFHTQNNVSRYCHAIPANVS